MSLSTERLSTALADRYRIERLLGQGGMATVYLAEDLKHKRKVAVKVLKPELAAVLGADRFVQEITTTASLSHPHILPLFDSGTADGFLFYVMPYVDGETLRDRLNRETQLAVDEALRITREIADALQYAHERGVIHRDIKPENILLQGGRPMVADFGIALAVSAAAGGRMTETGLSLGTPHYMSPEQATADRDISARSDVYSLASVCYEMLAGQPPHLGGSAQQIIMKIIAEPVEPVTRYRKAVPPHVSASLAQALEKLPADRFESAEAFARALGDRGFTSTIAYGSGEPASQGAWQQRFAVPLLAATAILTVAAAWGWLRPGEVASAGVLGPVWLAVDPPHGRFPGVPAPAISPDGKRLAFFALDASGLRRLFIRELGSSSAQVIGEPIPPEGTTVQQPFWSPDSRSVAYFSEGALYRTDVDGRAPLRLADASNARGGTWNADGTILFVPATSGLHRVSASGGAVVAVGDTALVRGTTDRWPHFLPDGRHFLFLRRAPGAKPTVFVGSLDDAETRPILEVSSRAEYANGHLYFVRDGALFAQRFDVESFNLQGEAVRVVDGVGASGADHRNWAFSVGAGHVVTWSGLGTELTGLVIVDASGREIRRVGPLATYIDLDLSPDGRRVVVERSDTRSVVPSIWLVDIASGQTSVLAAPTEGAGTPRWIPGTDDIIFSTFTGGTLVRQSTTTQQSRSYATPTAWIADITPDGKFAIFQTSRPSTGQDVMILSLDSGGNPTPHITDANAERSAVLSPDAAWLAYTSDASGRTEVIVETYPGRANRQVVSNVGGFLPQWSADGRTLYYISGDTMLVAATVSRSGASLAFSRRPLFRLPTLVSLNDVRQTYQPLRDGTFLLSAVSDSIVPASMRVGLNWAAR